MGGRKTPDSHIALAMAARPARLGLLVEAELKGIHWLRMFESALAAQSRFWGGKGNLILPLTQDFTDQEIFWAWHDPLCLLCQAAFVICGDSEPLWESTVVVDLPISDSTNNLQIRRARWRLRQRSASLLDFPSACLRARNSRAGG